EGGRETTELAPAAVADRLVEPAAGDSLGRALEPADPPRKQPGAAVAEKERDQEGDSGSEQEPALHVMNARQLALQRVAEHEHVGVSRERNSRFGVVLVSAGDDPVGQTPGREGTVRD